MNFHILKLAISLKRKSGTAPKEPSDVAQKELRKCERLLHDLFLEAHSMRDLNSWTDLD